MTCAYSNSTGGNIGGGVCGLLLLCLVVVGDNVSVDSGGLFLDNVSI